MEAEILLSWPTEEVYELKAEYWASSRPVNQVPVAVVAAALPARAKGVRVRKEAKRTLGVCISCVEKMSGDAST